MRDLPIPASPDINTTWPWPCHANCWRESTNSISALRLTKPIERAVRTASKRLSDAAAPSTAQTAMGSEMPLTSRRPAMAEKDPEPIQVLVRQFGKDTKIDPVLGKTQRDLNGALLTINTHSLTAGIVANDDGSSSGDGCAVKQIPDRVCVSIIAPS
jgi:hypothetical protein